MHLKNIRHNKKGLYVADTMPFYAIFAFVVSFLFILFFIMVGSYATDQVSTPKGLETYILSQRFLKSCFVYEDISGRTYPLVIDSSKFTKSNIDKCYNAATESPAFRLILKFDGKENILQTNNWNDNKGIEKREVPRRLTVVQNNLWYTGELIFEMQNV